MIAAFMRRSLAELSCRTLFGHGAEVYIYIYTDMCLMREGIVLCEWSNLGGVPISTLVNVVEWSEVRISIPSILMSV